MKCPDGWEVHDSIWIIKNEQVTHDRWLLLFYNYISDEDMPACWMHICKGEWRKDILEGRTHEAAP